jgi:hypothetical protein
VDSPEDQVRDLAAIRSCAPQDEHRRLTGRMRVEV